MRRRRRRAALALVSLAALVALLLSLRAYSRRHAPRDAPADAAALAPLRDAADAPSPAPLAPAAARAARPSPVRAPLALSRATTTRDDAAANGTLEGRVLSSRDGRPVPRAALAFEREGATRSVVADERGAFAFVPGAPGRYALVSVTAEGYEPFAPEVEHSPVAFVARPGSRVRDATIYLAPRREATASPPRAGDAAAVGAIAGRVLDARGAPAASALVVARRDPRDLARDNGPLASATAGADGAFALEGLAPGSYELTASADGLAPATVVAAAGARDVVLRLAAGASVRGVVRDAPSGRPLASFVVIAWPRRGALERGPAVARTFFDADGRYELAGLAPGPYAVTAAAHGHAPGPEAHVVVRAPPEGPAAADFALQRGATLRGRVTDARTRAPIEGARVALEGSAGADDTSLALRADATTNARGEFALEGVAPGARSLAVDAAGHHGRILGGLRVPADGDPAPIDVELTPVAPGEEPRTELVGIGAVLTARGDALLVGRVLPGGGAAEAGIAPGDAITRIDGEPVAALGFVGAIERIRGPEGSVVRLVVSRGGGGGGGGGAGGDGGGDGAVVAPGVEREVVVIRRRVAAPRAGP